MYLRPFSNFFSNAGVICPRTSTVWMLGTAKQCSDRRWEIDLMRMLIVNPFLWLSDLSPHDLKS
jgi:hypothetical protein